MTNQICTWLYEQAGALTAAVRASDAEPFLLPGKSMPPCRTVILAAIPYYAGDEPGSISLYARGQDYHMVIRRLFQSALAACGAESEASHAFADVSPFREIGLASAAGLGQIGQNGLLLTKPYGSYVFLGELCGDFDGETVSLHEPESMPDSACVSFGDHAAQGGTDGGGTSLDATVSYGLGVRHLSKGLPGQPPSAKSKAPRILRGACH